MLIGVLFAGHLHTSVGEIKVVPTATAPVPVSRIPNNLGICVHASRILDFIPVLKKKIDDGEAKKAAAMP